MINNKLYLFFLTLTAILFIDANAQDQELKIQKLRECTALLEQITGATIAEDWKSLEKYCLLHIEHCKGVVGDKQIAISYASLASAYIDLREYSKGLDASNAGIDLYYSDPTNHMYKARILSLVKNKQGALESYNRAEKLAIYNKDSLAIELIAAPHNVDKELLKDTIANIQSEINKCEAVIAYCKHFKKLL